MMGNIGNLFVKCMQQVTKGHLHIFENTNFRINSSQWTSMLRSYQEYVMGG